MVNLSRGDQWPGSPEGTVWPNQYPGLSVGVPGSAGEQVGWFSGGEGACRPS